MKKLILIIFFICFNFSAFAKDNFSEKKLYEMNKAEINRYLDNISNKSLIEKVELISEISLGTNYLLGPLGEGKNAEFIKKPLIDLQNVDCVTFCEQTYAFALSKSYKESFNNLQKIRYKNGDISLQNRNHFFMSDWSNNNKWLFEDITKSIGSEYSKEVTRNISHNWLFKVLKLNIKKGVVSDKTLSISYIPKEKLALINKKIKSGDIAVFIQDNKYIFASHTGIMIRKKDESLVFRNATSLKPKKVVDIKYLDLIKYLERSKKNLGLAFLRPKVN